MQTSDPSSRRDTLKLPRPPAGQEPVPPTVVRLRGRPGEDGLEFLPDTEAVGGLELSLGARGEAERHLAQADTAAAMSVASTLMGKTGGDDDDKLGDEEAHGRCVMARALLMEGRLDAARTALGRHRDDVRLALADAALHLAEGHLQQAETRIRTALKNAPDGVAEHYVLSLIRVTQGDAEDALQLLRRVSASLPEHAVARHQLGKLTQAEGDPARAGTLYEAAWELAPNFVGPALALAEMFMDSRQYGEAMNILSTACDRAPNLLAPRLLQLRILLDARRTPAALQLAEALMTSAPGREDVTLLWAETLGQAERGGEAQSALEKLLASGGVQDVAKVLRLLSRLALNAEPPRVEDAARHLEEASRATPANGELLVELAQLHMALRRPQDASATLERLMAPEVELGSVLSGAVMASKNGLTALARKLGQSALDRVAGTPVEDQLRMLVGSL